MQSRPEELRETEKKNKAAYEKLVAAKRVLVELVSRGVSTRGQKDSKR